MVAEAETETIKCGLYPQVVECNGVAIGVDSVPNSHSQDVLDMEYARRRAFNT